MLDADGYNAVRCNKKSPREHTVEVLVNAAGVRQEIVAYRERRGHRAVPHHVALDVGDALDDPKRAR